MFGLLPSGNYESSTPETKLGENIGHLADPFAIPLGGLKTARYAVSGGTPISRLIANSIPPLGYTDKWGDLKRVLTNPKVFKEAVIDDIPQYVLDKKYEDRLFPWRTKLGLGKPNDRYNQILDPAYYAGVPGAKKHIEHMSKHHPNLNISTYHEIVDTYEKNKRIDKIWNKFGSHVEDGNTYYHYKNPDDYFKGLKLNKNQHWLFGNFKRNSKLKGDFALGGVLREDYYDNWDFAYNRPIKDILKRGLAEALLQPLEFKGTAKKIYRKPNQSQIKAKQMVKDYFVTNDKSQKSLKALQDKIVKDYFGTGVKTP